MSTVRNPQTTLTTEFSAPDVQPTAWATGTRLLAETRIYTLATVHRSGQPHLAPLYGIWLTDTETWYFCTGAHEQKAVNLRSNPRCTLLATTGGTHGSNPGLDIVIQGEAEQVSDHALLQRIAAEFQRKYGWEFPIQDGVFLGGDTGNRPAPVFAVAPVKGHAFSKGEVGGQTRWIF